MLGVFYSYMNIEEYFRMVRHDWDAIFYDDFCMDKWNFRN